MRRGDVYLADLDPLAGSTSTSLTSTPPRGPNKRDDVPS